MKFYLAKEFTTPFLRSWVDDSVYAKFSNPLFFRKLAVPVDVIPVDQKLLEVEKCAQIKARLESKLSPQQNDLLGLNRRRELKDVFVSVGAQPRSSNEVHYKTGHFNLSSVPNGGYSLPKLIEGFDGVTVQVDVSVVKNEQGDAPVLFTVSTQEMPRNGWTTFEDCNILFPATHFASWMNFREKIWARVTIAVTISDAVFSECFGRTHVPVHFDEEVLSDVALLGGDGSQFKANRCFLAAHSSVFAVVFERDMKEGKESTLEIPEMGAKSVRAFLKYLYYNDTWDAEKDPKVASDLFNIAHKYGLACLEGKMKTLMPDKPGSVQNQSPAKKKLKIEEVPVNRQILEDPVLCDVTIVCGDGAEIKANRCFLAAQSSVFQIMFQTDMAESRTSILELPTMEKKSVQVFLKYLYFDDFQDGKVDFQVAFDLLCAGHMYDVNRLEGEMRKAILSNSISGFDVDGATKLFMFARNLTPVDEDLKKLAVGVLAQQCTSLEESGAMQELVRTDYKAVLELMKDAFQHFPS